MLQEQLAAELRDLGVADVTLDEHGYLMATIPATIGGDVPAVGFIAHVDTSPEMPGDGVTPIVHRAWDGGDIVLPDDPTAVLRAADHDDEEAEGPEVFLATPFDVVARHLPGMQHQRLDERKDAVIGMRLPRNGPSK